MKKINKIILWIFMIFITLQFSLAWGCDNKHCQVSALTTYCTDLSINNYTNHEDYGTVHYILDLNFNGGTISPQGFVDMGAECFNYQFNNWYSSKYIDLSETINGQRGFYYEIQPLDPEAVYLCRADDNAPQIEKDLCANFGWDSKEECRSIGDGSTCSWDPYNKYQSVNYLGLPFYISQCHVDCDYNGLTDECSNDGDITATFDYRSNEARKGLGIVDLSGIFGYGLISSELENNPGYLYTEGRVRTNINYDCNWEDGEEHNVAVWCELAPNLAYRHNSADDKNWSYEEIIPDAFLGYTFNDRGITDCTITTINMSDNSFNPYNHTVSDINDFLGIGYDGNANAVDDINNAYSSYSATHNVINQIKSNNELVELNNRLSWQRTIITIIDIISTLMTLVYYVFIVAVLIAIFLYDIPLTFRLILDILRKATQVRKL